MRIDLNIKFDLSIKFVLNIKFHVHASFLCKMEEATQLARLHKLKHNHGKPKTIETNPKKL